MDETSDPALLREVVDSISEGVYFVDLNRRITFWNRGAERITGYRATEVVGRACADNILKHVDRRGCELCVDGCPLAATMSDCARREIEVYLHHKDGHRVPVSVMASPIFGRNGIPVGAVEVFSDRSERFTLLAELEALKKEVLTDPLTGLGNRRFAELSAASALRDLRSDEVPFGLLILDIDHFKKVNDRYGHAVGDRSLRMVAWTLANAVRRNDAAIRWGGEEFLALCPHAGKAELADVSERIRSLIERSFLTLENGSTVGVTVSVGGAVARAEDDLDALVARADAMLYACKEGGRNRCGVAD